MGTDKTSVHKQLDSSLQYFARKVLQIKDKSGVTIPFEFNDAQEYLHAQLEKQRREKGWVRALILKGRQQGCSTYVAARYYHKCVRQRGRKTYILSHKSSSTQDLFKMVARFYEKSPEPLRPRKDTDNTRQLEFGEIDSEYSVGTAGSADVGRGGTVQLFHGSEVAFWEKTEGIETGVLQSVADLPETEIILESTANGMNGYFYQSCMDALEGKGDYQLIFIPWFWQSEYRRHEPPDGNWGLTEEERAYKDLYKVDDQQIYWRRAKIITLKSDWKFKQEYPSYPQEAFQTSGHTLIDPQAIMEARKSTIKDKEAPLVIGVDPGRNHDRTIFAYRRGREFLPHKTFEFDNDQNVQMLIAGSLAREIDNLNPQRVFIDIGHGWGVVDRLKELGYGNVVQGVNFGEKAIESDVYLNKRAEMWCLLRDWVHREEGEVNLPDDDVVQRDIMSMPREEITSSNKTKFPSKDQIKKTLGMSPDVGDAMALTFAYPVWHQDQGNGQFTRIRKKGGKKSPLRTLQRVRESDKLSDNSTPYWYRT